MPRRLFGAPVLDVAPGLLGALLVADSPQGRVTVRVTEVEAYAGADDPGSHAARGRTPRNAAMFGPPGHLYVYFTYGMHWCVNVVCQADGDPAAVLLRAGEVVEGQALAAARRTSARSVRDLARGPARLAQALGLDGKDYGLDLTDRSSPVRLLPGRSDVTPRVVRGPRVGVAGPGGARDWRLWLEGEPTVSSYRAAVLRRRSMPSSGTLGP